VTGRPIPAGPVTLPPSVRARHAPGGLPQLLVSAASATAEIYLQGAHVTSWVPTGQDRVIWMSRRTALAHGLPFRGGVPVCFPWFGPHAGTDAPLHGFARISEWTLTDVRERGEDVLLTLCLSDSASTRASGWPHRFTARYVVTVGAKLSLALEVENTGPQPITFAEAFHTYLSVGDVRAVTITGLESRRYVDRLTSPAGRAPSGAPLRLTAETDRVYEQPGCVTLVDPTSGRSLSVTAQGSANVVVWNPWIAKAVAMDDFADEEWTQMVCVETCNVLDDAVTLGPGERHTMVAIISASSES
jgi:D-hexose-6-phosphate mutarotase